MFTARRKIQKEKGLEPTDFEDSVAQALFDLENSNQELKSDLKDLFINSAVQYDVAGNRKAVVIRVPYRLSKAYRKIHVRLVRELEKKFSGKDIILVAARRILKPPKKGSGVHATELSHPFMRQFWRMLSTLQRLLGSMSVPIGWLQDHEGVSGLKKKGTTQDTSSKLLLESIASSLAKMWCLNTP